MNIQTIERKGLIYFSEGGKRITRTKPWLGDLFSPMYDGIMERSVFPKKFGADMELHERILAREFGATMGKRIIELGTGSGNMSAILSAENSYTGVDISPRLLKTAQKRFMAAGFEEAAFYITSAETLPFPDGSFDLCISNLSLNFFPDLDGVLKELGRILTTDSCFFFSVPVPERIPAGSVVHGKLYTEDELKNIFIRHAFSFTGLADRNGAVLYARAVLNGESP